MALGKIGNRNVVGHLTQAHENEKHESVKGSLKKAIEKIQSREQNN